MAVDGAEGTLGAEPDGTAPLTRWTWVWTRLRAPEVLGRSGAETDGVSGACGAETDGASVVGGVGTVVGAVGVSTLPTWACTSAWPSSEARSGPP